MKKIITFSVLIVGLLAGFLGCSNNVDSTKFIQVAVLVQEIQRNITHELTQEEIDTAADWADCLWRASCFTFTDFIYTKPDGTTIDITAEQNKEFINANLSVFDKYFYDESELARKETTDGNHRVFLHYEVNDSKTILLEVHQAINEPIATNPYPPKVEGIVPTDGTISYIIKTYFHKEI